MFSQNPRQDKFRIIIPESFFIKEICDKYNKFLQQKPYVIRSIEELLIESIQGFETPDFEVQMNEQTTSNELGVSSQISSMAPIPRLNEKTFNISFRHTDGYLTYYMMQEHLFYRAKMGPDNATKRKPFGTVVNEMLMPNNVIISRAKYHDCFFTELPGISLSYSTPQRDSSTFDCKFAYNKFETTFDLPDLKLKK